MIVPVRRAVAALAALGTAVAVVGCGAAESLDRVRDALPSVQGAPGGDVPRATCPADAGSCRAVTGRVVFVESVDPDGDGDLHLVVAGGSVTLPGLTILDVAPGLRPEQDPRIGDVVTGAGPVYPGSRGQSQIQVTEFRVVRPR